MLSTRPEHPCSCSRSADQPAVYWTTVTAGCPWRQANGHGSTWAMSSANGSARRQHGHPADRGATAARPRWTHWRKRTVTCSRSLKTSIGADCLRIHPDHHTTSYVALPPRSYTVDDELGGNVASSLTYPDLCIGCAREGLARSVRAPALGRGVALDGGLRSTSFRQVRAAHRGCPV